jgi:cardiolipin synthase
VFGNLPNVLTLMRILLLPFFAAALIYGNYSYALILFLVASVTDLFDGIIARMRDEMTLLGSILDPVADKFLLITSFIIMSIYNWIPIWLTITVISRDLIVVTGWLILSFVTQKPKAEPSFLGKIASTLQFILIGLVLLSINVGDGFIVPEIYLIAVAVSTAVSGILYIYSGLKTADLEGQS